jgi:hypothetical protein
MVNCLLKYDHISIVSVWQQNRRTRTGNYWSDQNCLSCLQYRTDLPKQVNDAFVNI